MPRFDVEHRVIDYQSSEHLHAKSRIPYCKISRNSKLHASSCNFKNFYFSQSGFHNTKDHDQMYFLLYFYTLLLSKEEKVFTLH